MTEPKISPFKLTPARLTILILGILAIAMIASASFGSLNAYQHLKEAAQAAAPKT